MPAVLGHQGAKEVIDMTTHGQVRRRISLRAKNRARRNVRVSPLPHASRATVKLLPPQFMALIVSVCVLSVAFGWTIAKILATEGRTLRPALLPYVEAVSMPARHRAGRLTRAARRPEVSANITSSGPDLATELHAVGTLALADVRRGAWKRHAEARTCVLGELDTLYRLAATLHRRQDADLALRTREKILTVAAK